MTNENKVFEEDIENAQIGVAEASQLVHAIEAGPYCPIPEDYFERRLSGRCSSVRTILSIEPWITSQLSELRK